MRMLLCECCLRETKLHDVQKAACFLSVILTPTTVVKSLTACLSTTRTLTWMFLENLPKVGFIVYCWLRLNSTMCGDIFNLCNTDTGRSAQDEELTECQSSVNMD